MGGQKSEIENKNLTIGTLIKLAVAVAFIVGHTVAIYAWVSAIDKKVDLLSQEQKLTQDAVSKHLTALDESTKNNEKATNELTRAVDKATGLLESLDKHFRGGGN